MNGYDAEWEKGVVADHRKELQFIAGECLQDVINLVKDAGGTFTPASPIIGDLAHAMFMQRSSHVHFYIQKRKREDADKILKDKFPHTGRVD